MKHPTTQAAPRRPRGGLETCLNTGDAISIKKPHGRPGDRLWVRETWRVGAWDEDGSICVDHRADGHSRKEWINIADEEMFERLWVQSSADAEKAGIDGGDDGMVHWKPGESPCQWRPSIHMPRVASRILLEVTDVLAERVGEISTDAALQEGSTGRKGFAELWDSINGKKPGRSWADNPWVWVLKFKVLEIKQ